MVIIEEIEITNCFSIEHLLLRFEKKHYVTISNCPISCKLKDKLILAIQPFLLRDFIKTPLECNPGVFRKLSSVRVKFIIPKGKFKTSVCVDAMRTAQKPDYIYYYFDEEQYIEHIGVFHERCRIDVTSLFPCLNQVFSNENKNLMSIWIANECLTIRANNETSYELLANYFQVFHLRPKSQAQNIANLTTTILTIDRHTDKLEVRTFIDVSNKIGEIFKYLTFGKYAVGFHIPLTGQNVRMEELKWEDMDLTNAETCIENIDAKTSVIWNKMETGLKYLLKIAQKIALAKSLGQHCIIIKDTEILKNYQNEEMIKEAIIEDDDKSNSQANWKNKNFLNQIVNVCNDMKIMIFMNYHGGLPLPPENANIIKSLDPEEFSEEQQLIYVSEQLESMSLGEFVRLIKTPIRKNVKC